MTQIWFDKNWHVHRFHLQEQESKINKFDNIIKGIDWYTQNGPAPGKGQVGTHGGPRCWNSQFHFPRAIAIACSGTKQLHADLKVGDNGAKLFLKLYLLLYAVAVSQNDSNAPHNAECPIFCPETETR